MFVDTVIEDKSLHKPAFLFGLFIAVLTIFFAFNLKKLIANKFRTNRIARTKETANLPKKPLSLGSPITGLRNSPKKVSVKLKAKKIANTAMKSPKRNAGLCSDLSSITVSTNIPLSKL